ncbi:MAG: sulfite exporter TauE/SafE family protein [Clostridiales bacterium]|nr:sulfite exporter TauE/SafE family protein [Clostridiales bacterium]
MRLFIVCMVAGLTAGVGTGFAGLSAATVIAPMLIAFMGYPWYESVGIGLASDVLASAFSAYIYRKNGRVDVTNGIYMLISVLCMTVVGSYFSQYMPNLQMGYFSIIASVCMGVNFIIHPVRKENSLFVRGTPQFQKGLSVACGAVIGFYCGAMGVGGGMMMLFILTAILGYELKTAVGTSVFIMTFTALTGAVSHFYFGEISGYIPALLLCVLFTLVGAIASSSAANHMEPAKTGRATGATLVALGICMVFETIIAD